jgi:hypothetical protein
MQLRLNYFLFFSILCFFLSSKVFSASYYFNTLYKATGTSYTITSNSYTSIQSISGSSFQFYQAGSQFSGNDINGVLYYYNSSNVLQTIYGTISRRDKLPGNVVIGFNFLPSNASYTTYTGEAYIIVVPGKESNYNVGSNISTSSDSPLIDLNALLSTSNTISLTSAASTTDQRICLSSSIIDITYSTTGATGANFSGLPSGVNGIWVSDLVTISGTPTQTGQFTYTVSLTGGSNSGTQNGTIIVITAGSLTGDQTIALPGTTTTTFSTDGTTGGSWTSSNTSVATVGLSTGIVTGQSAGTSVITYSVSSGSTTCSSTRTVNVTGTLPVIWHSFTASKLNGSIILNWSTASEQNTKDFEVQYSTNATSWDVLGTVQAAGNSSATRNYSFTHQTPLKNSAYNYYRILQRDIDGKFSYSKIVSIIFNEPGPDMSVYPNPVSDVLTVYLSESKLVRLINAAGAIVWQSNLPAGRNQISVSQYSKGVYVLTAGGQSNRVIIQ